MSYASRIVGWPLNYPTGVDWKLRMLCMCIGLCVGLDSELDSQIVVEQQYHQSLANTQL